MEEDTVFETADIDLTAYLMASGHELSAVQDDNPNKLRFRFAREGNLHEAVNDFYSGRAMVNALKYSEALETVRDHVWDARRRKGKGDGRATSFER